MQSGWEGLLEGHQHDPIMSTSTASLADPSCRVGSVDTKSETKLVQTGRCHWLEGLLEQSLAFLIPSPSPPQPSSLPGKSPCCKREAYKGEATSTWSIEGVVESIVVVPMEEGQADVSWAVLRLPKHQRGHVAPELKGSFHRQAHLVLRQVGGPVHHPVGQVPLVPPPACKRGKLSTTMGTWTSSSTQGLLGWRKASRCWEMPRLSQAEAESQPRCPTSSLSTLSWQQDPGNHSEGATIRSHPRFPKLELQPSPKRGAKTCLSGEAGAPSLTPLASARFPGPNPARVPDLQGSCLKPASSPEDDAAQGLAARGRKQSHR